MTAFELGALRGAPAGDRPDLVAETVLAALTSLDLLGSVGVVEIDPDLSDTAATQQAYGLEPAWLVNCVLVGGARAGEQRTAACLVPATHRADVNGFVRRRLDVRKASFLPREIAVETSGMEFGGITAFGLPAAWPVLVAAEAAAQPMVVVGSGVRRSKLLVPGSALAALPTAEVSAEVARPV